ncbi:MAG: hypothetical protein KAJ03_05415 [Gammaproteobacteria bacterium]|nr:hypothetical protein [Gammaproteobacteria bacterium]
MIEVFSGLIILIVSLLGVVVYLNSRNKQLKKQISSLSFALTQQYIVREVSRDVVERQEGEREDISNSIANREFFD